MTRYHGARLRWEGLIALVAALLCSVPTPAISAGGAVIYSYDALGRLTEVQYPTGVVVTYALDAAGNRTSVTTTQPPAAPGVPVISSIAGSTATATWTAPSGAAGYKYTLDAGANWTSTAATSVGLSGLAVGTQYTIAVQACDTQGGCGAQSSATFATAPSAPGAVTITNIAGTTATASWGAATDHVGVSGYEYSLNGGTSWTNAGNALTVSLTGLTSAVHYTFNVRAYDAAGTRGGSSSTTFTTLDTIPPSAPGTPTISNVAAGSATATWTAATDNVGVTGYEYSLNGGSSWTNIGNSLSTNLTGLTGGTQYTFSTRAYDAAGNLGPSSSRSFTTTQVVPSIPTGLSDTVAGNNKITLTWNASSDSGGPGIGGYKIYRNGTQIGTSSSTSYSDTGVTPFNTYTYTVAAYDTRGTTSAQSSSVSASTFYQITDSNGNPTSSLYTSSVHPVPGDPREYEWSLTDSSAQVVLDNEYPGTLRPNVCEQGPQSIASGYEQAQNSCIVYVEPSAYGH